MERKMHASLSLGCMWQQYQLVSDKEHRHCCPTAGVQVPALLPTSVV